MPTPPAQDTGTLKKMMKKICLSKKKSDFSGIEEAKK